MSQVRRLTASERRAAILEAAASVFGTRGYEATRMDDVAGAAGVAKGLLYKHFGSKDALFEALLDQQGSRFADELVATMDTDPDAETVRGTLVRALELWMREVADPRRTAFTDPGRHDAYDAVRTRIREVIAGLIRRVEPGVDEGSAWLVAAALQGAAESAGLAWAERPGGLDAGGAAAILAAFCWEGLGGLAERLRS